MFTGITRGCGTVESFARGKRSWRLGVRLPKYFPATKVGGSISVNGACLTLIKKERNIYFFDVVGETLRRTHFDVLERGSRVNLEPALRWNDRIEGHFVQGHVDAAGSIREITREKSELHFQINFPQSLKPYILEKGSIAVNGVSLTVGRVQGKFFWVYIIPHTLRVTNFGDLKRGDLVNLEADVLVKFFKTLR